MLRASLDRLFLFGFIIVTFLLFISHLPMGNGRILFFFSHRSYVPEVAVKNPLALLVTLL